MAPGNVDYDMPMTTWLRSEGGKLDRKLEFTSVASTYARGDHCLVEGYEEVKSKRVMEFRSLGIWREQRICPSLMSTMIERILDGCTCRLRENLGVP